MSRLSVSRRKLLKNAALMALLGPVLRKIDATAAGGMSPRRLILVFNTCGPMSVNGPCSGSETGFQFHPWWQSLERHRTKGIFFSQMAVPGMGYAGGNGHGLGCATFTGYGGSDVGGNFYAYGESIDQIIARRLVAQGRQGRFATLPFSLHLSYGPRGFWAGNNRPVIPKNDPQQAWSTIFSGLMSPGTADAGAAAVEIARKKSILDFVAKDCTSMRSALGAEGMRVLDEHCTTMRSMEQNLSIPVVTGGSCVRPADPGTKNWADPENLDARMRSYADLTAMALACELTHVVTLELSGHYMLLANKYGVASSPKPDDLPSGGPSHHPWTHNGDKPGAKDANGIFTKFYADSVALLADKLSSTLDANGKPLIDSTVILWMSELGGITNGTHPHIVGCQPAVLLGNGQGTFRTGRHIRGNSNIVRITHGDANPNAGGIDGGKQMGKLLVSMMHYMGLTDVQTVGKVNVNGPLQSIY